MYQEVENLLCDSFLSDIAVVFYTVCKDDNISFFPKHRLVLVGDIHQHKACTKKKKIYSVILFCQT